MKIDFRTTRWLAFAITAMMLFVLPAAAEEKKAPEGKAAVETAAEDPAALVNGSVISQKELNSELDQAAQRISLQGRAMDDTERAALKEQTLEGLIDRELLFQDSRKKGITVEETEVADQITQLKGRFKDEAGFQRALSFMNINEAELKITIERGMAIQKLIQTDVAKDVTVSDDEKKAFYDGHPEYFKVPEQVKASHILIKVDSQADDATKAKAREKIETVRGKVNAGGDFAELAKAFSEGPSSVKGGDLGFFKRGQMVKPFEDKAFALAPGEVSDVVETRFGYHLIKVVEKKPETVVAYEDVTAKIGEHLSQEKTQQKVKKYVEELRKTAKIERF